MDKFFRENINFIKALSRLTFQVFLVIDPQKDKITYVSPKFYDMFPDVKIEGCTERIGVRTFFARFATEESLSSFNDVYQSMKRFSHDHSEFENLDYILEAGLMHKFNVSDLYFSITLTPLPLSESKTYYLCVMSVPTSHKLSIPKIWIPGTLHAYFYDYESHEWKVFSFKSLTFQEKTILALSSHGFTLSEISAIMCKSVETVKSSRRIIFQKLGVENIQQATMFALNHNII